MEAKELIFIILGVFFVLLISLAMGNTPSLENADWTVISQNIARLIVYFLVIAVIMWFLVRRD